MNKKTGTKIKIGGLLALTCFSNSIAMNQDQDLGRTIGENPKPLIEYLKQLDKKPTAITARRTTKTNSLASQFEQQPKRPSQSQYFKNANTPLGKIFITHQQSQTAPQQNDIAQMSYLKNLPMRNFIGEASSFISCFSKDELKMHISHHQIPFIIKGPNAGIVRIQELFRQKFGERTIETLPNIDPGFNFGIVSKSEIQQGKPLQWTPQSGWLSAPLDLYLQNRDGHPLYSQNQDGHLLFQFQAKSHLLYFYKTSNGKIKSITERFLGNGQDNDRPLSIIRGQNSATYGSNTAILCDPIQDAQSFAVVFHVINKDFTLNHQDKFPYLCDTYGMIMVYDDADFIKFKMMDQESSDIKYDQLPIIKDVPELQQILGVASNQKF